MPVTAPPCPPVHLAIVADDGGGAFTGMSHAGTYLTLRNTGARACSLPAAPLVRLLDGRGRPLPTIRRGPAGPSGARVTIEAGGRVRLSLRWVSGPVYEHNRCLTAKRITVAAAGARIAARLCGPAGAPIGFDQTALKPIGDRPTE